MTDTTEFGEALGGASQEENFEGQAYSMADLPEALRAAAQRLNWSELMPVQVQTIPHVLSGLDVMVQSQTGSGKTGAFLLPILNRIEPDLGAPQALVLVPTRELAVQVTRDAEELGREVGVRPVSIYGGVGYKGQIQGLESGAQLVVGTPGRILDHLLKGTLNLDRLKMLVFDEADRMLSMGFYPDMKQLQRYLPRGLQSTMFSATYPGHVKRLAQQFLKDPIFVSLSQEHVHVSDVLHVVYKVPAMQKSRILVKIIEQENPASAIIFCNTKADVHFVSTVLRRFGYDVGEISADLSQVAREEVLEKLRLNKLKFLVATDVAARGIDIHELSHVFQYQPPQDHEAYVHRTGRTGRAGAAGVAISLVSGMEEIELEQIAKKFSIPVVEHQVPADEELETLISQRAVFLLESRLRKADNIQKERMQRFMRTVGELAANDDSRALLAMLVDEFYQSTFHAPLEQPSERLLDVSRPAAPSSRGGQAADRDRADRDRADRDRADRDRADRGRDEVVRADGDRAEGVRTDGVRAEGGRAEGEKRKRRRSRKKPGSGAEQPRSEAAADVRAEMPEEIAVSDAPVPVPAAAEMAPVQPRQTEPETDDYDGGEEYAEESETGSEDTPPSAAPKKRRRRRPRKSGAARAEAVRDGSGEQAPSGGTPAAQDSGAAAKPSQPSGDEGKDSAGEGKPARGRERSRSGRKKPSEMPSEQPAAPAKPKKKIFLE